MTVKVELSDAVSTRLSAEATRRGVGIDQVIADLADLLPPGFDRSRSTTPKLAFIAAGASETGITTRIDEMLADGFGRELARARSRCRCHCCRRRSRRPAAYSVQRLTDWVGALVSPSHHHFGNDLADEPVGNGRATKGTVKAGGYLVLLQIKH